MPKQCRPDAAGHCLRKFTVPQRVKTIAAIDFSAANPQSKCNDWWW